MSLSDQAEQFRSAYGVVSTPTHRETQRNLIAEEFEEFSRAHRKEPEANVLKELADLVYVCFQYAANQDWDLEEALFRVHKSNMSKLGLDGQPIRRSDGKVLKGPNYKPPYLDDLIK